MDHSIRRALRVTFLAALAAALVVPATVAGRNGPAGGQPTASPALVMSIGTRCMDGEGFLPKDTVRLTQRRGTKTLTDVTFTTSSTHWSRCLASPATAGDLVRFVRKVGTKVKQQRTITVPDLRISGDLETNTLTVDASIGGVPITTYVGLGAYASVAGLADGGLNTAAILDSNGHSETVMTWAWTLRTGDHAFTSWESASSDRVYRWWAPETMTAQLGKVTVTGTGKPAGSVSLTLKAAGGAIRAAATGKPGRSILPGMDAYEASPVYATTFRSGGTAVTAKAGDRIVSAGMDAAGQTLLVNDFQATAGEGDATLTGTCHPGSRVAIQHGRYVEWSFDSPSGDIARSDLFLTSGDKVVVGCQAADGYGQRFPVTIP